jgi:hypothetical protein
VEGFIKNQIVDIVTGKWFYMLYLIMVHSCIFDNLDSNQIVDIVTSHTEGGGVDGEGHTMSLHR